MINRVSMKRSVICQDGQVSKVAQIVILNELLFVKTPTVRKNNLPFLFGFIQV